ncbi:MAG: nucleotidyltransferase domain-containing protein [Patescibacteria group bacterium]
MNKIKFSKKHIDIFKKMGIKTIYLFGSYAKGKTHPMSDFDIGVVFDKPEKYKDNTMKPYLKLYDIFTDVLPKEYLKKRFKMRAHEFDLVFLQFAPIRLQFNVIKDGVALYEKDKKKKFDYKEYVMKRYCDLEYFYNLHYNSILESI